MRISKYGRIVAFSTSLIGCFLLGCDNKSAVGENPVARNVRSMDELGPDDILVKVGDRALTKREYDRQLKFNMAYGSLVGSRKMGHDQDARKMDDNIKSGVVVTFIQNALVQNAMDAYVATNGPLPEATAASARKEMELLYGETEINGRSVTCAGLEAAFDKAGVGDIFRENFKNECRTEQFLQSYRPDFMVVDGITVTNFQFKHKVMNAVAVVTNESIMATARDVLRRAKAGEDFAELADAYSMDVDKESGGSIGDCTAADFGGEEDVFAKINALDEGCVTELIDAEDSYRIYKLYERIPADKSDFGIEALRLARIYFRKAVVMPSFTDDEAVHELYRARRSKVSQMVLRDAMFNAKVEFPNGWKMFPGDSVKRFMAGLEETVHPGGDNPYLTKMEQMMLQRDRRRRRDRRRKARGAPVR